MKNLCFLLFLGLSLSLSTKAQPTAEDIPVYQGNFELDKNGRSFSFAFAQGDKVLIKLQTGKKSKYVQSN